MNINNIPTGTTQISRQQIVNFPNLTDNSITELIESLDLEMSVSEIKHCQGYYKSLTDPNINIDEIKTVDAIVRDNKNMLENHLLSTLTTSKEYIAKTYEDMMSRRRTLNKDYQEPPSITELIKLLPDFLKKNKRQKIDLDDMAIFTGVDKYALASNKFSKPIVEIGTGKDNALVVSGAKADERQIPLLIGDTLYAVLKSFNQKKGFDKKLSELVFSEEFSKSKKETAYIKEKSIMTYLADLPFGIKLHTSPYERKTESYSYFADYAAIDEGIVFSAKRENVADLLIKAQEIGLVVIKLGTLTAEKTISAFADNAKIFSLSQDFLKTLVFKKLISATLNESTERSTVTENSMYISTNQQKYRLCHTSIRSKNAFMSALNSVIYNYSLAISSDADNDGIICGSVFNIDHDSVIGDGLSLILGAYRAEAELSLVPTCPTVSNNEDPSHSFYTLIKVKNNIPEKLVGNGSLVYYLEPLYNEDEMPDFCDMRKMHSYVKNILKDGSVLSILPTTDDFDASFKKIKGRAPCEMLNSSIRSHFGGFIVESTKELEGVLIARTEKKETAEG